MAIGSGIEAGKAFVKFLLDDKEFESKLKTVGKRLQTVGAIGVAATAPLVAALTLATRVGVQNASAYADVAARAGVAADALQRIAFVADENGVSLEAVAKNLKKFQQQLGDTGPAGNDFRKFLQGIGVDVAALEKQSPDEQIVEVGAAIAAYEDPARRAALANKAFGKSGGDMLPMLAKGAAAFRKAAAESDRLRATLSNDEVEVIDALGDAWGHSSKQLQGLAGHIAAALAGPLTKILEWGQEWTTVVIGLVKDHPKLTATVAGLAAALLGLSTAIYAVGKAMALFSLLKNLGWIVTAIKAIGVFFVANPVVAAIAAIAAAVGGLVYWLRSGKKASDDLNKSLTGNNRRRATTPQLNVRPPTLQQQRDWFPLGRLNLGAAPIVDPASASVVASRGAGGDGVGYLRNIAESNERILSHVRNGGGLTAGAF